MVLENHHSNSDLDWTNLGRKTPDGETITFVNTEWGVKVFQDNLRQIDCPFW